MLLRLALSKEFGCLEMERGACFRREGLSDTSSKQREAPDQLSEYINSVYLARLRNIVQQNPDKCPRRRTRPAASSKVVRPREGWTAGTVAGSVGHHESVHVVASGAPIALAGLRKHGM